MHESVKNFTEALLKERTDRIKDKHIIEIGSRDVNGSVKPLFLQHNPFSYLGVDISAGRNVDLVWDVEKIAHLPFEGIFDWVVCTEVLEHVRNWSKAVRNLKWLLKPGGYMLITTRSEGFPWHDYPEDHWRYTLGNFRDMFADFVENIIILDPLEPGIFYSGQKPLDFQEADLTGIEVKEIDETTVRTQ